MDGGSKRKLSSNNAKKKSGQSPGKRTKLDHGGSMNKAAFKEVSDEASIFAWENPPSYIGNRQVAAIEPVIYKYQHKIEEDTPEINIELHDRAWYLLNNACKIWALIRLKRAPVTIVNQKKTYGEFEDCTIEDQPNILFYNNFISKKFPEVKFIRNSATVKTTRGFNNLTNSVESYILAHSDPGTRELILGANQFDSSNFSWLSKKTWKVTDADYKEKTKDFFTRAVAGSFSRLLIAPFSSQVSEDKRRLRSSVLPWFESVNTSLNISICPTDNPCFYQIAKKDEFVYKIFVESVQITLQRIRFADSLGYQLSCNKLFKPCTRERILFPSIAYEIHVDEVVSRQSYLEKNFQVPKCPTKVLVFKCKNLLLKNGGSLPYGQVDIDTWEKFSIEQSTVRYSDLQIYESDKSLFSSSDSFMKYLGLVKMQSNFLCNFPFSKDITIQTITSDNYKFPSLMYDFSVWKNPSEMISPPLGHCSTLQKEGTLYFRLAFNTDNPITAGTICFVLFFEDNYVSIGADRGDIQSPLMAPLM